eukprot:357806-Chlamydomonas_euryale.AAC.14
MQCVLTVSTKNNSESFRLSTAGPRRCWWLADANASSICAEPTVGREGRAMGLWSVHGLALPAGWRDGVRGPPRRLGGRTKGSAPASRPTGRATSQETRNKNNRLRRGS